MDKNKIIQIIESAKISDDFKKELRELVEAEENGGPETIQKIQAKLDEHTDQTIDALTELKMGNATEEFNQNLDDLDKDVNDLQAEVNKKKDEIDLKETRTKLQE